MPNHRLWKGYLYGMPMLVAVACSGTKPGPVVAEPGAAEVPEIPNHLDHPPRLGEDGAKVDGGSSSAMLQPVSAVDPLETGTQYHRKRHVNLPQDVAGTVVCRAIWNGDIAEVPPDVVVASDRGIAGVTAVIVRDDDDTEWMRGVTGTDGRVHLSNLPEGSYRVILRHPGLVDAVEETVVRPRSVTLVTVGFRSTPRQQHTADPSGGEM